MPKFLLYVSGWNGLWPIMQTCISRCLQSFSSLTSCSLEMTTLLNLCTQALTWIEMKSFTAAQVEVGKRERMLTCAEIDGLKKYHFKEMHELQDQLLTQRSLVSKLTLKLQEAMQVHLCIIDIDKLAIVSIELVTTACGAELFKVCGQTSPCLVFSTCPQQPS